MRVRSWRGRANEHGEESRTGDQACLTRAICQARDCLGMLASFMRDAAPSGGAMQQGRKGRGKKEEKKNCEKSAGREKNEGRSSKTVKPS